MNTWTVDVKENKTGELFIELPPDVLDAAGLKEGDTIEWIDNKDGTWTLKKSDKVWVMVECVSMFRERYMVQAPASHPKYALDDVTGETAKEFSQKHIGETIVSHRIVSHKEALELCDEDNDYSRDWNEEQKINAFFTKEGEKRQQD
jgi:bifunctional DNA-binding transcriptional regulator/antitoxin component of YhaV-PrlF toxin-antitoxin module